MARVSEAQTNAVGRGLVEQHGAASRPLATVSSTREAEAGGGEAARVHRAAPAGAPVLADAGVLAPADPGDPLVAARRAGGRWRASAPARAVDVDPGVAAPRGRPTAGRTPRTARRRWLEPGGLRVAEVGVGDDEGVDGGRAQQVVVAVERVVVVAGEEQHVVAGLARGLHQRVHEAVHQRRWRCPPAAGSKRRPIRCEARVRRLRAARLGE